MALDVWEAVDDGKYLALVDRLAAAGSRVLGPGDDLKVWITLAHGSVAAGVVVMLVGRQDELGVGDTVRGHEGFDFVILGDVDEEAAILGAVRVAVVAVIVAEVRDGNNCEG